MSDPVAQACSGPHPDAREQHRNRADIELPCMVHDQELVLQQSERNREQGKQQCGEQDRTECLHESVRVVESAGETPAEGMGRKVRKRIRFFLKLNTNLPEMHSAFKIAQRLTYLIKTKDFVNDRFYLMAFDERAHFKKHFS